MKIGDILRNNVKEKLARGEVVASMTVRLVPGVEIVRIAKSAGFDTRQPRTSRVCSPGAGGARRMPGRTPSKDRGRATSS